MCLILFTYDPTNSNRLTILANRDEFYSRRSSPAHYWPQHGSSDGDGSEILAGRDDEGGGTWLALNVRRNRFAAVTNYREGVPERRGDGVRSRGQLPLDFVAGRLDTMTFLTNLCKDEGRDEGGGGGGGGAQYNGYHIMAFDGRTLGYHSNRCSDQPRQLSGGMYGLSNGLIDAPWPKVVRGKELLTEYMRNHCSDTDDGGADDALVLPDASSMLDILLDSVQPPDAELPDTGVGLELERGYGPLRVDVDTIQYGTRCSTLVVMDANGPLTFVERTLVPDAGADSDHPAGGDRESDTLTFHFGRHRDAYVRSLLATNGGIVIFTCTWYSNTSDLRFNQCIATLREANAHGCPIVVVDGSPSPDVHAALCDTGAIVCRQTYEGGKGAALREAAQIASALPGVTDTTLLCWQEPEKTDMVRSWGDVLGKTIEGDDVVVPHRTQRSFITSYPIEQYHSESYGNLYLDTVMNEALKSRDDAAPAGGARVPRLDESNLAAERDQSEYRISGIDWHFGPFAFRAQHIELWTAYTGGSYDAQVVPIVHAMRRGLGVCAVSVDFELDARMKAQEEGDVGFIEKRLNQLGDLDPRVKRAWTDDFYC